MDVTPPTANHSSFIPVPIENSPRLTSMGMHGSGSEHPYDSMSSSPTHNLVRRTPTLVKPPWKRRRLSDESDQDGRCAPIFPSSAIVSIESDYERRPLPEQVPSAMQTEERKDGDMSRTEDGRSVSADATVKPEPSDPAVYMDMSGSHLSPVPRAASAVQALAPEPSLASIPPKAPPVGQGDAKLGIGHIDLLYKTDNGIMTCRLCLYVSFLP